MRRFTVYLLMQIVKLVMKSCYCITACKTVVPSGSLVQPVFFYFNMLIRFTCVVVRSQGKSLSTLTLVTTFSVSAYMLTVNTFFFTFIHICEVKKQSNVYEMKNQQMSLIQFYSYMDGSLHVSGPQARLQESSHSCSHNHWFLVVQ